MNLPLFENTVIWKCSLGPRPEDAYAVQRERLRNALRAMRNGAGVLVGMIASSCRGLTVHDITHLDALWEMADLIAGPSYLLNPAEAFVFGASILLHDAGMSVAAYPGGIEEVRSTTEWNDSAVSAFRRYKGHVPTHDELVELPPEVFDAVLFDTLRGLHALQAEKLANVTWKDPSTQMEMRLIEDFGLLEAYGSAIGRIAHSHNWSIGDLAAKLRNYTVGAASDLPAGWTLDEIKVATLLRCCDAAHIDNRRAPSLLFALSGPTGISREHWSFQNKLNKPIWNDGVLFYSSGRDFKITEAPAWWLCYDTIQMIDSELRESEILLLDSKRATFRAKRVYGSGKPQVLSQQIKTDGWSPVEARIKVSDPINLALTLGGRNLYGRSAFAAIRELLQNAVDAVRARRRYEGREAKWGEVRLLIEQIGDEVWLHVDDTGIGMSERVLVGPLLDFGRSFWSSPLVREEFPGLEGHGVDFIGKFGIGFFAIFVLGKHVKVITRRFDAGSADARVLEFYELSARPLLRNASRSELPADYTTRVSVLVEDQSMLSMPTPDSRYTGIEVRSRAALHDAMRQLVCAVDVNVDVRDMTSNYADSHKADWVNSDSNLFLDEILAKVPIEGRSALMRAHEANLSVLRDSDGRVYGRAALNLLRRWRHRRRGPVDLDGQVSGRELAGVSVGGFLYPTGPRSPAPVGDIIGVLRGDTEVATRQYGTIDVPSAVLSDWATRQGELIDAAKYHYVDVIAAAHDIFSLGGDPGPLPFCLAGSRLPLSRLRKIIADYSEIHIPLEEGYEGELMIVSLQKIPASFFMHETLPNVVIIDYTERENRVSKSQSATLKDAAPVEVHFEEIGAFEDREPMGRLRRIAKNEWRTEPRLWLRRIQIHPGEMFGALPERWVFTLSAG